MVYKINESIIRIQAEALKPIETKAVFWSYDRGTAKLVIQLLRKDNIPQVLSEGTTVPIRLMFNSATAEDGIGKHDYLATIEDRVNGIVSITLEDNILGYVGTVRGSVYINFPDTRSLDTAGRFNFEIRRSPIDGTTPELEDYYFNGFSQTIDKIEKIMADGKQEIDQKIADSEQQINEKLEEANNEIVQVNQSIETLNHEITEANNRIDQTNQQISDLGNLKKMYSNSIDFGDYDYSGNPNLLPPITAQNFTNGSGATVLDGADGEIIFTLDGSAQFSRHNTGIRLPAVTQGQSYTISADIKFHADLVGDPSNLQLSLNYLLGGNVVLRTPRPITDTSRDKWITIKQTMVANFASQPPQTWYVALLDVTSANLMTGTISLRNIKIGKGSTADSWQPNLLLAPWEISKVALNPNLARNGMAPITNSNYLVNTYPLLERVQQGESITITLKGTKLGTNPFRLYMATFNSQGANIANEHLGDMTSVDGLTDTWKLTISSYRWDNTDLEQRLRVYQGNGTTLGSTTIEWCKIERSLVSTPPITFYKYFGEGLKDSNDPNDYSWDITPEYTEKGLNDKVSLTEPQAIEGTKNFLDQPLYNGDALAKETFGATYDGGQISGVTLTDPYVLPWGNVRAYDNERSKYNDIFTTAPDRRSITILKDCTLQFIGKFTCQTGNGSFYAYLGMKVNGGADWRMAGMAGTLNWRNDVGFFMVRGFKAGDVVTLSTSTNYTTSPVPAWGVDHMYIKEVISAT
ncbi:BppU family phage baseplate upper protein [Enterococcus mundtii]|uniref:BppU family phage baseplate upper protein n=1 Tax=Enterococcus mundtii TaxID=53346 RepID=UPI000D39A6DE|nr:BppU family phage baseplate upper protein [Enterococcus mundtii]PTO42296.1 hypothetical protein C6P50_04025 [Enterococcus mundtii]